MSDAAVIPPEQNLWVFQVLPIFRLALFWQAQRDVLRAGFGSSSADTTTGRDYRLTR
jgi:hypothetical protein